MNKSYCDNLTEIVIAICNKISGNFFVIFVEVCTKQTCFLSSEQDFQASASLQYFIKMLFSHTFFPFQKIIIWFCFCDFGFCTWPYCNFTAISINCAALALKTATYCPNDKTYCLNEHDLQAKRDRYLQVCDKKSSPLHERQI